MAGAERALIGVAEALAILARESGPLEVEERDLDRALGAALADAALADRDFPPTDRSAMDGFAVRAADCRMPGALLAIAGEVRAGQAPEGRVEAGEAWRIYTGAVLPPGADAVVMIERTSAGGAPDTVVVGPAIEVGDHVRHAGSEVRRGQRVIEPGAPIRAAEVAVLASLGQLRVKVRRPPIVHVLSTGDEVVEPEREPLPHQVRNSNARCLLAQLDELDVAGRYLGIAGDERSGLDEGLARGLAGDLLLVTGGVSVGEFDLVRGALEAAGMRVLFHGVSMKPGKPILAGRTERCLVLALPGNPVSAFTGFTVFARPLLRRMLGWSTWQNTVSRARLGAPLEASRGRETYHLARLEVENGERVARAIESVGSGDVVSLARANAFLVRGPEDAALPAGAEATVLEWG